MLSSEVLIGMTVRVTRGHPKGFAGQVAAPLPLAPSRHGRYAVLVVDGDSGERHWIDVARLEAVSAPAVRSDSKPVTSCQYVGCWEPATFTVHGNVRTCDAHLGAWVRIISKEHDGAGIFVTPVKEGGRS